MILDFSHKRLCGLDQLHWQPEPKSTLELAHISYVRRVLMKGCEIS